MIVNVFNDLFCVTTLFWIAITCILIFYYTYIVIILCDLMSVNIALFPSFLPSSLPSGISDDAQLYWEFNKK